MVGCMASTAQDRSPACNVWRLYRASVFVAPRVPYLVVQGPTGWSRLCKLQAAAPSILMAVKSIILSSWESVLFDPEQPGFYPPQDSPLVFALGGWSPLPPERRWSSRGRTCFPSGLHWSQLRIARPSALGWVDNRYMAAKDMQAVTLDTPLLYQHKAYDAIAQAGPQSPASERRWHGALLNCCGDCGVVGCGSCLLGRWCSCFAFG